MSNESLIILGANLGKLADVLQELGNEQGAPEAFAVSVRNLREACRVIPLLVERCSALTKTVENYAHKIERYETIIKQLEANIRRLEQQQGDH